MQWVRRGVVVGATAWAGVLPLATFAASQAHPTPSAYLFAFVTYVVGGAVCHQLEPRSFHLWGHQMPVCARCTGIYVGAAIAAATAFVTARKPWPGVHGLGKGFSFRPGWTVSVAATPIGASLVYEWTTGITPSNLVRAATGAVLGYAVGWLVVTGMNEPEERTTL